MIQIIIFSKDRAFQLDALLRSIKEKYHVPHNIMVLYTHSNNIYKDGYRRCIDIHSDVKFMIEANFKKDTELIINNSTDKYITFFTDDDIVKLNFDYDNVFKKFENHESILTIALRLGLHCNRNYVNNTATPPPANTLWKWKDHHKLSDWGYPMSIQGNIFRSSDIKGYTSALIYSNPNSLEGCMYHKPIDRSMMICYPEAKVIGLQINRVAQSINRFGSVHQEYLNTMFLNNKRMKLSSIYKLPNQNAADFEINVEFENYE